MPPNRVSHGGATRASLKHSLGMIALRLVTPLSMRDENRERRRYLRERRRYERYRRERQQAEAGASPDAHPDRPDPPSAAMNGTVEGVPTPEEASSRTGRFRRRLCSIASKLHRPRTMSRQGGRASRDEIPMEPPRLLPHWHGAHPKPTPAYIGAESQPVGSHPGVSRCRARRSAAARGSAPENESSAGARMSTSAEAQGSSDQATVPQVINREDMPARYRHTRPW
ncbi:hypothetical protein VPNG_05334 [Cytospora leucostoma]|uniref:Uncharacterized protein n=1 Tax=Cytospora leucostoma TaxID=1230097 RepID=A0A423X4R8_9PEZI|nr:hypothetical protein VPNG_05334 [Cytospora leucostoma]